MPASTRTRRGRHTTSAATPTRIRQAQRRANRDLRNATSQPDRNIHQVLVTPEMAANWLKHNEVNRKVSPTALAKLKSAILRGEFRMTHQPIAITSSGRLLDGAHRLTAVVETETPVWMRVCYDANDSDFAFVDTGRARQAHQFIKAPSALIIASAARTLAVVTGDTDATNIGGGIRAQNASVHNTIDSFERWPELAELVHLVTGVRQDVPITASPHLAVLAQASRTEYKDKIPSWIEGLKTGENLKAGDPRLLLRRTFRNGYKERSRTEVAYPLIVKAWNAHATGASIGILRQKENESVPKVIGFDPEGGK